MTEKSATATKPVLEPTETVIRIAEREEMFERLNRIYKMIERRAFEIFEGNGKTAGHELDDWSKAEFELLHPMHIKISENDTMLTIQAEVPGFGEKDLDIQVEPTQLIITGKRETSERQGKGKTVYQEHCSDQILRVIDLPAEVDKKNATATLKNGGILEIQLPKAVKQAKAPAFAPSA